MGGGWCRPKPKLTQHAIPDTNNPGMPYNGIAASATAPAVARHPSTRNWTRIHSVAVAACVHLPKTVLKWPREDVQRTWWWWWRWWSDTDRHQAATCWLNKAPVCRLGGISLVYSDDRATDKETFCPHSALTDTGLPLDTDEQCDGGWLSVTWQTEMGADYWQCMSMTRTTGKLLEKSIKDDMPEGGRRRRKQNGVGAGGGNRKALSKKGLN